MRQLLTNILYGLGYIAGPLFESTLKAYNDNFKDTLNERERTILNKGGKEARSRRYKTRQTTITNTQK